jgi:hypothetical protein
MNKLQKYRLGKKKNQTGLTGFSGFTELRIRKKEILLILKIL